MPASEQAHPAGPHIVTPAGRPTTPPPPGARLEHVPANSLLFPRPPATTGAGVAVPATDPEAAAVRPTARPKPTPPPANTQRKTSTDVPTPHQSTADWRYDA
ncbi:hypothetical protein ACOBQX_11880 [Actinokineospora sp. G85]|uniref:hypothetical protein n=1 Tax=Actinokineospora sp. G85 TaxID=3406626 RepID=UPI003C77997E